MAVKDQVAELSRRINPKQKNLSTIDGPQCVDPMLCSRRQRGADVWVWREDWRAYYAKSPTSRSYPKTQSLEQGPDHRPKTSPSS